MGCLHEKGPEQVRKDSGPKRLNGTGKGLRTCQNTTANSRKIQQENGKILGNIPGMRISLDIEDDIAERLRLLQSFLSRPGAKPLSQRDVLSVLIYEAYSRLTKEDSNDPGTTRPAQGPRRRDQA